MGERKLDLFHCVFTFCGTWVSAATILGMIGSVYESGYAVLTYAVIPWFIGAFLLIGISNRLYDNDILTIPELFCKRYQSPGLQVIYGVIFICVYIFYLVIQIKGFGIVASILFDLPYTVSIFLIYLFIIYTTFGGYPSMTRSDVFNFLILGIGMAVLYAIITGSAGGVPEIHRRAAQLAGMAHPGMEYATEPGDLLKLFGKGKLSPLMNISMFCGWGLGLAANPQYTICMVSARDKKTARATVVWSLVLLAFLYFALIQIGLGLRVLIPSLTAVSKTDEIVTHLINNQLYGPWSGFWLFAVVGVCVSTANTHLLLIASSFSYDIVNTLSSRRLSEQTILTLSRVSVLVGGSASLLLAIDPPESLITYGGDIWGIVSITLFPTMYGTLLYHGSTRQGIYASVIAGVCAIALLYPPYYQGALPIHPAMPAVVISSAAFFAGSFLTRRKEPQREAQT